MTVRTWAISTVAAIAALMFTLIFTVNILIDPYGEFRIFEGNFNELKIKAKKTTALQVAKQLNEHKFALVFGSSRTMLLSSEFMGKSLLNFSTSIYNNPGNVLSFLNMLSNRQIKNITHIYFLIDVNGFNYTARDPEMSSSSALRMESLRNIGPQKLKDAWKCINANLGQKSETKRPNHIDSKGILHKVDKEYKQSHYVFNSNYVSNFYLDSLAKIAEFSKGHKITTTFFTVPWVNPHAKIFTKKLEPIFQKIANVCDKLYRFDVEKKYINKYGLFSDHSHLNNKGMLSLATQLKNQTGPYQTKSDTFEAENFNWKKIRRDEFIQVAKEKLTTSGYTTLINELEQAGRLDLSPVLYENSERYSINKNSYISDLFHLSKSDTLKKLLDNDLYFFTDPVTINKSLHSAVLSGNAQMVKNALLLGADVDNPDQYGDTPLFTAIRFSPSTSILNALLSAGASTTHINRNKHSRHYNDYPLSLALRLADYKVYNLVFANTQDNEQKEYCALLEDLNHSPLKFAEFKRLIHLHKKILNSQNVSFSRLQINPNYVEHIKTINGAQVLQFKDKTYLLTNMDLFLLKNFTAKKYARNILAAAYTYKSGKADFVKNSQNTAIMKGIGQRMDRLVSILSENNMLFILN